MKKKYRSRVKNRPKQRAGMTGHYCYEQYMLALPKRADAVARCRHILSTTFSKLFADENFVTLLQAESVTEIPICLKSIFEEGVRCAYEIG